MFKFFESLCGFRRKKEPEPFLVTLTDYENAYSKGQITKERYVAAMKRAGTYKEKKDADNTERK